MATDLSGSAARGAVGAMAMTGVRTLAGALGLVEQTPPEAIATEAALGLGRHQQPRTAEQLVLAGDHVLYGLILAGIHRRPRNV